MHITIFGASRGVGRAAVDVAVARGHRVTAVARSANFLNGTPAQAIVGDVFDEAVLRTALAGADAVLVALGTTPAEKSVSPQSQVCSRATGAILREMTNARARRVVVVSSYGVGPTRAKRPFPFNLIAATVLKEIMADKERQEREVRESSLEWTIAQPLGLTDAPPSGTPYVATDGTRKSGRVARADVAAVCIDAIESHRFVGESIAISG